MSSMPLHLPNTLPPSLVSLMFDSRNFFPPKEISPKDTETSESPTPVSPSSSIGSSSPVRSTTPPPNYPFDESIFAELDNSSWIISRPLGGEPDPEEPNEMFPKRTSTSEALAMTQAAIKKLVADSVSAALEAQAANMANTDNTTRPRKTHVARKCTYKEFMSCQPFYFNGTEGAIGLIYWFERTESVFSRSNYTEDYKVKFSTGNVTASKPQTLEEAITKTQRFMEQVTKHNSAQDTNDHKQKFDDSKNTNNNNYPNDRNNNNHSNNHNNNNHNRDHHQQNRRQETFRSYAATNGYTGNRPLCESNRETLSFDDVKSALLSKQKYDDDVEPESDEGLVIRFRCYMLKMGCYSNRETLSFDDVKSALLSKQKYDDDVEPESDEGLVAAEVAIAKGDFDGDVYLAIGTEKSKDELIVDSSCTFHMIPHQSWFTTYESFNGGNVYMGNHFICPVIGKDNIRVKMHDGGVMRIFKGALVLMKAIQSGGLYVLQGTVVYGTTGVATSKASLDDSKLWHYRLGHMGEKGMKNLAKKGLIKVSCNLEFCEHCVFGKQKRVSFSLGIHKTRDALDYIHSDLWGPSLVTSRGEWKVLIENQTGKKIKKLRINNGLEFYGESFNFLCQKYGIARHHTLVRTPQQNGVAERMNMTIMEKVRFPRAVKCIFLGYGSGVKGYHVLCPDPKYHKIIHSRDVTFNEKVTINFGKDLMPPHNVDNNHTEDDGSMPTSPQSQPQTEYLLARDRQRRQVNRSLRLEDYQCDLVAYAFAATAHIEDCEPTNYLKAISSLECDKWVVTMEEEMKDGIPGVESNRYKARYVVCGFDQREGIDFNEEDHVYRLKKLLYDLKQSPRQWYKRFDSFMIGHGYDRRSYDECVYLRKFLDGSFLYLVLYVDDMLIAAPNKDQIMELEDQLSNEFDMKDLGAAKRILGMEIRRDRKIGKLTLSQTYYISKVLKKFNMSSCKPVPNPLAPHFKLSSHECPKFEEDKEDISRVPYSSAVGSLMYAMVCTRPNLAHSVSVVGRYMHNPGKMHWEAVKCILRYLKGTSNIGLSFEKGRASPNGVVGYVDSDYAGDLDANKSLSL
nr:retrovirus-related Pol polyprotein from transposon TNT 1-94 [Tanacetum cinerariifolium]